MSPEEGQEEFEEVSQELRKREEVVGVVSISDMCFVDHNKRIGMMCYTVKSHPLWSVIGIYMTYKCVL